MAQSRSEYLEGHDPTNIAESGRFLHAELPDTDLSDLSERFDYWKENRCIPERVTSMDCPTCGGRLLSDGSELAECDDCDTTVFAGWEQ